jgi:hypothetical protein
VDRGKPKDHVGRDRAQDCATELRHDEGRSRRSREAAEFQLGNVAATLMILRAGELLASTPGERIAGPSQLVDRVKRFNRRGRSP